MLAASLLLSLVFSSGRATVEPTFRVENLKVEGNLTSLEAVDLDGDEKLDLLAVVRRGKGSSATRELAIFWNKGAAFTAKPDLVLPVEDELCAFDLASLDQGPASSLIAITPAGVRSRAFTGRTPSPWKTLVTAPTLFLRASREKLPRVRIAQKLTAAASPTLFLPTANTLMLFAPGAGSYAKTGEVPLDVDMSLGGGSRINESTALGRVDLNLETPSIELADLDADGLADLFLLQNDVLKVFRQSTAGQFSATNLLEHTFKVTTDAEEKEGKGKNIHVQFDDVDGDGRVDALVTKSVNAGITSSTTMLSLFLATAKGYGEAPDQTLTSDGASLAEVVLQDVTGDGRPDLIIPSVKIGVMAIIRILTSRKANVGFMLHPWVSEQKKFALSPTAERTLTFDLDLAGKSELQAINMTGDFDGDGQRDLVFGVTPQELAIFRGTAKRESLFDDDALAKINVRATGSARAVDLDGHKRSDVVLWYGGTPEHQSEITVIHNQVK